MRSLSIPKKTLAMVGVIVLVVTISGTALAMLDAGQTAKRAPVERSTESGPAQPGNAAKPQGPVELSGAVDVIAVNGWVVGGQTVIVNDRTRILDTVSIGTQVRVQAQRLDDGSLVATKIERTNSVLDRGIEMGNANANFNANENENENENLNGNFNTNENENENENLNGNFNANENENENENLNGNFNANENENENHNGNFNTNENENENQNHNSNMNNNQNDDEHGTGNHNSNEHGDGDHASNSNSHGDD